MNFFKKVKNSIYDPAFYKTLPESKSDLAVKYFLILILILSVVQTGLLALPVFAGISELTNKALPKLIASYPDNLEVRIKNGMASTNATEPYFFPVKGDTGSSFKNYLVIDTIDPYSPSEFKDFSTIALLTKESLYYQQEGAIIKSVPLNKVRDITLNQQFLNQQLNKYSPLFKFASPVVLLIVFVFIFLAYIFRLVYLLFLSLIIFLISKIMKPEITYGQSYKVSMYAITLGLLVEVLLRLLSPVVHLPSIPFMVTIISAVIFAINFKSEPKA